MPLKGMISVSPDYCLFLHIEVNPEYSLEGLMLKQKIQYFGNLLQGATFFDSLAKTLMLGKVEGSRRRQQQRMR